MPTDTFDSWSDQCGFPEAIAEHIAPVLAGYGFECKETRPRTKSTPGVVRFASPKVTVAFSYSPMSNEIDVRFTRTANPFLRRFMKFDLCNMLDAVVGPNRKEEHYFQASTPERMTLCMKMIAEILQTRGQETLAGEPRVFWRMWKAAIWRGNKTTRKCVDDPIRQAAEEAWRRRDYAAVRRLYERIEHNLQPSEKRKLEYATKQLGH